MNIKAILLSVSFALVGVTATYAQSLTISNGGNSWSLNDFTIDGSTDIATISNDAAESAYYHADLTSYLPANASGINAVAGGWVFTSSTGTVVVAQDGMIPQVGLTTTSAGDPFVAYSYFFTNTSGSTQNFSVTFSTTGSSPGSTVSPFSSTTYNPTYLRATFGVTLTDGSAPNDNGNATEVMATASQTATASYTAGGTANLSQVALTSGPLTASDPLNGTVVNSQQSAGYPGYVTGPSGTFDALNVTVSGTFSDGSDVGVSGRVELVPEPSPVLLLMLGALGLAIAVGVRRLWAI